MTYRSYIFDFEQTSVDLLCKFSFGILIVEQQELISNYRLIRAIVGRLFRGVLRLHYFYSFPLFFLLCLSSLLFVGGWNLSITARRGMMGRLILCTGGRGRGERDIYRVKVLQIELRCA